MYRQDGSNMERIFEQTLLYDFYGELLTEHQQKIYEDAVYNDMSLSEIASDYGISRQGVHDLIKRCDRILQGYESKLHLVEKFTGAKEKIREIEQLTQLENMPSDDKNTQAEMTVTQRMQRIKELSGELMKEW
jgi:predicted DNA-binding protein YlxM (UPF0122 family)